MRLTENEAKELLKDYSANDLQMLSEVIWRLIGKKVKNGNADDYDTCRFCHPLSCRSYQEGFMLEHELAIQNRVNAQIKKCQWDILKSDGSYTTSHFKLDDELADAWDLEALAFRRWMESLEDDFVYMPQLEDEGLE